MKTIKVIIEKSSDGFFGAYAENVEGIYGSGEDVKAVKQSILDAIETNKEIGNFTYSDYQIKYCFDAESLLQYYKGILSNPTFEQLTGINQKQIHHYATGLKKPRKAQRQKIQDALHNLGRELLAIEL
ncbi:type II toxin-antitoxin system HicB family antitoxin [Riemerella anatipestifer]|uniref:type II toxin-antitoxin system HicB family antitoxin n=1 Tax=Riemerella anatipestifer TaxID=34085 RepID=UPI00129E772A|nr:type II toxin-antitoxin system HicB family antitoxin [Riemerella anatipestifer]MBT0552519.1 type II toxin-antitoxin system HicB family antitoxin [Riemerella anatipestifer]MBT0554830.1 type II toxin-antitoxin system HicB family antitoxin [Riemerella anatipestifer]MCU7561008.1 type II toxin-antitoxin system HicB family antitoxin [Riemerella anatipestifer]MDY3450369.1 type II toxin-antitoxin system HicB family antitoxin [Riemerella anatipestifer]MRN00229.1 type II toxin-antitoxin system HicB f